MADYIIFTDSGAGFVKEQEAELDIRVVPMPFTLAGQQYLEADEESEVTLEDFYHRISIGAEAGTLPISEDDFKEAFRPALEGGYDVLYLGLSSALSPSVKNAQAAAEKLAAEFKDAKITVVDTLCAACGQALMVWHAVQKKREGKTMREVAAWAEETKLKVVQWFTLDNLKQLKKSGLLPAGAGLFGKLFGNKSLVHMDQNGVMVASDKRRGRKNSMRAIADKIEELGIRPAEQAIFVSHADCIADARSMVKHIKRRFETEDVFIVPVSPTIGAYTGAGFLGVAFIGIAR